MEKDLYFLYFRKFYLIVPVFFGCLGSLILSAQLMFHHMVIPMPDPSHDQAEEALVVLSEAVEEEPVVVENVHFFARAVIEHRDIIQELYQDAESRDRVIDFFAKICDSREIAEVILANADKYNIAPALALALAWEESRLNPHAVNNKNRDESIDRGLFQLNNRSFPRLEIQAFFNPELNAHYGMGHLRYCLDTGGSEIVALAMYNAGTVRVRYSGTPKSTLDYISRILKNRNEIEGRFNEQEALYQDTIEALPEIIAEAEPVRPRFMPLMPLVGQ
jgi:hypothetical protein